MPRDKIHKHVRVREILEDGKWHSMSELSKLVGTTASNIHIIVGKISLKELDFKFKCNNNSNSQLFLKIIILSSVFE
jgi:hypothetical protein